MRDVIFKMITDRVESCVDTCISSELPKEEWDLNELNQLLTDIIPLEPVNAADVDSVKNNKELKHLLKERAVKLYEAKETEFPEPEQFRELERVVLLKVIDRKWMDHIDDMDQLRQGIGLQAYGQRDPLVEYGQGDYSRNKGLDFRYRRRRLGCRCDYHCGMPDCLDCRLVFRYLFFGRGFGKQYDNAKRGTGNQHRLPNAA